MDLSDGSNGVALLNDCKYGHATFGSKQVSASTSAALVPGAKLIKDFL